MKDSRYQDRCFFPTRLAELSKTSRTAKKLRTDKNLKIEIFINSEILLIPTIGPQNLSPGRFRHAEVESEVQNLEILHLEAKN